MSHRVILTTPPAQEPAGLALATVKNYLKIAYTSDDSLISSLAVAARMVGETTTKQNWCTQTWDCFFDSFGEMVRSRDQSAVGLFPAIFTGQLYPLRGQPLQSVQFIQYLAGQQGNYLTWNPADYIVSTGLPGRIAPIYGQPFPILSIYGPDAVWMRYTSGWDNAGATVPQPWIQACLLLISHFYEHRLPVTEMQTYELPMAIDVLFSSYGGDYGLFWA